MAAGRTNAGQCAELHNISWDQWAVLYSISWDQCAELCNISSGQSAELCSISSGQWADCLGSGGDPARMAIARAVRDFDSTTAAVVLVTGDVHEVGDVASDFSSDEHRF